MKLTLLALALLPLATAAMHAQAPTIDYPTGSDWTTVTRPAGSVIAGAMHTDMDEYRVPLSAAKGSSYPKTVTARGPVDYLAYSGPSTVSTLANHERVTAQLVSEGYKPVWTCVRE